MTGTSFDLTGKTAVVTGGGSGIGRAIAERFAAAGASVRILDVALEPAEQVAAAIARAGGRASAHRCDVSDQADTTRCFQALVADGPLDILVNNAGVSHIGTVESTTEQDFDRLYRVNVRGVYNCTHAAIGAMKARGRGVIVNMASIAASTGLAERFAYSMTKGAVLAMTYSIARDYARHGIRCVSISPARIHTPFVDGYLKQHYPGKEAETFAKLAATQPIGRMGEPHEVADLALYLCSDAAGFATGTDYPLDGGFLKLNG
ncbi:MAG: glucose 1-dehydrogenase [Gemmatimonadota bacterium]|nr:glucose 1-dehydrogenase [Gemmatimonadota bacterium]MDE3128782.1 glucose 1-dehydrogenase [Gemmatimonadota bacterium]MDE3172233.1 glucose 1-dehydrogenase [Gemmatimonadota bacterium]MDE3216880.1 glucose 1-dehydrogenase [Gemmatimonadota bacterium]